MKYFNKTGVGISPAKRDVPGSIWRDFLRLHQVKRCEVSMGGHSKTPHSYFQSLIHSETLPSLTRGLMWHELVGVFNNIAVLRLHSAESRRAKPMWVSARRQRKTKPRARGRASSYARYGTRHTSRALFEIASRRCATRTQPHAPPSIPSDAAGIDPHASTSSCWSSDKLELWKQASRDCHKGSILARAPRSTAPLQRSRSFPEKRSRGENVRRLCTAVLETVHICMTRALAVVLLFLQLIALAPHAPLVLRHKHAENLTRTGDVREMPANQSDWRAYFQQFNPRRLGNPNVLTLWKKCRFNKHVKVTHIAKHSKHSQLHKIQIICVVVYKYIYK